MREGREYGQMVDGVKVTFTIESSQLKGLDQLAANRGITRSGALRLILSGVIGEQDMQDIRERVNFRICCKGLVDNAL